MGSSSSKKRPRPVNPRDQLLAAKAKDATDVLNEAIAGCARVGLNVEVKVWGKKGEVPVLDVFVARPL